VPGVFVSGNVLHVHDIADFVTLECEKAGTSAATVDPVRADGLECEAEGVTTEEVFL